MMVESSRQALANPLLQREYYPLVDPDIGLAGPWDACSSTLQYLDAEQNYIWSQESVEVVLPNPASPEAATSLLAAVPDVRFSYFGQPHHLDMFIGTDELRIKPDASTAQHAYMVQLQRLQEAQENGHVWSTNALSALHHVAQADGKIAFVHAHGGVSDGVWRLFSGEQSKPADEVIRDLASRKDAEGKRVYAAIFLSACNRQGIAPNMDGVGVPVIAQMDVNGISAAGNVRVFFPEAATPPEEVTVTTLRTRVALWVSRLLRPNPRAQLF